MAHALATEIKEAQAKDSIKLKIHQRSPLSDLEWCPQEVHVQMGESAKRSYITAREAGNHEIMAIMTQVSDDLEKNWGKYDKDAFVNAWDIGNYVSDYLIARSGGESCDCNAAIFNPDEP